MDLSVPWGFWCLCTKVFIEVSTLDVLPVLTRPLHGDVGILDHTYTVELYP